MSVGCVSGLFYIGNFMFEIWGLEKMVDISCRDGYTYT